MVLRRTAAVGRKRHFGLRLWLREYFAALRICINAEWLDISGSRFFPHGPGSLNRGPSFAPNSSWPALHAVNRNRCELSRSSLIALRPQGSLVPLAGISSCAAVLTKALQEEFSYVQDRIGYQRTAGIGRQPLRPGGATCWPMENLDYQFRQLSQASRATRCRRHRHRASMG